MKNIYKYLMILALTVGVYGCKDPFKDQIFKAYDEPSVSMWLEQQPQYSNWVYMLKKVDVLNALNLGSNEFTFFVADDNAVENYLNEYGYESIDDIPLDELDYLVRYHIISGKKFYNADLLLKLSVPTVSGDYLTAGIDLDTEMRYIDNGEGKHPSFVIEKDMLMSNGVIHRIDRMLEPLTTTLWDMISRNPDYSIFAEALAATGYDQWLDRTYVEINETTIRDYKTVFVVPNSVFKERGIKNFKALKEFFSDEDPSVEGSPLNEYMKYHMFGKLVSYADLTTFPSGYKSMIYYNLSDLKGLSVLDADGMITINPESEGESFHLNDARRDVPSVNGYLHEIDNLGVLPQTMSHYVVVYEPTDKLEFRSISFYREEKNSKSVTQTYSLIDNELTVPGIRWESVPDTKAKVWYTNEYANGRYSNYDALHWNLGTIGWIEFDIPVIPMGKYTVQCEKYNTTADGCKCSAKWDDLALSDNEINFATGANYATWKTFNLAKEEHHTITFTVASVSGVGGVDRFVFIPVE